jgi:hypothetical protein
LSGKWSGRSGVNGAVKATSFGEKDILITLTLIDMIAVQTFWSKPFFGNAPGNMLERYWGGFQHKQQFYACWYLSFLQLKKYFSEVVLVTDRQGRELLIDHLKIPYTRVYTQLERLRHTREDIWTLGKIVTYGFINEPFFHCDGDLIVFESISDAIRDKPVFSEYFSRIQIPFYGQFIKYMEEAGFYFPDSIMSDRRKTNYVYEEYNTGMFGGTDITFIKEYADKAYQFFRKNQSVCNKKLASLSFFGIVCEQYVLKCEAAQHERSVYTVKDGLTASPDCLQEIAAINAQGITLPFIHLNGPKNKEAPAVTDFVDKLLAIHHPAAYHSLKAL